MKDIPAGKVIFECGRREPGGSIFEGGCGKDICILDAYRCVDCGIYFHRDCASAHFGTPTATEQRNALLMDEWEPQLIEFVKDKDVDGAVGIVYSLALLFKKSKK